MRVQEAEADRVIFTIAVYVCRRSMPDSYHRDSISASTLVELFIPFYSSNMTRTRAARKIGVCFHELLHFSGLAFDFSGTITLSFESR